MAQPFGCVPRPTGEPMNADQPLDHLREVALEKIAAAERAAWVYLVEFAKADLGPDLARHLDAGRDFCHARAGESRPWRLDAPQATLALRFPDCTEVVVGYQR